MKNNKRWFERNPKKTLFVFFIIVFLALIFTAEIILSKKPIDQGIRYGIKRYSSHGINRYIKLREHNPFSSYTIMPSKWDMEISDSLIKENYVFRVDENGFIMPSKIHKNPDVNIIFLGASTTECLYVTETNRFPHLVGKLIENKTGLKVNSFNSGVAGNNSLHSIGILLNKALLIKPEIAVMMHNINDLSILALEKSYWNNNPSKSAIGVVRDSPFKDSLAKIKNTLIPNLYVALYNILSDKLLAGEFDHVKGSKIQLNKDYIVNEFKNNLRMFISISKIRGITPALMTQANRLKDMPDKVIEKLMSGFEKDYQLTYKEYKEVYDLFNQAIRDVGKENKILVIDLANKIPQEKEYMYDIVHFNENGSKFAAEIISEHLMSLIKKDKK